MNEKSLDNSLANINGFDKILKYYIDNRNNKLDKWLTFDCLFDKPGKQGIVGLFNVKNNNTDSAEENKNTKIVFKISQYINYLVYHEYSVMKGLNELSPYCPHFCKTFGIISSEIDPKIRETDNPFRITSKYPIEQEILLTEYIDNSTKFYNYIKSSKIKDNIIYSTIKQVLMAVSIAQRKKRFTHYDLHSYNIMMKQCNKDLVFLYVLDEDNQFCVPTNGHFPVIIDFGFSYINDLDNGPAWPSLGHTQVGFMSDRFDSISDPKLFLTTVAYELKLKRRNRKTIKFNRIVKNMFNNLKIDRKSGWDEITEMSSSTYVLNMLEFYKTDSNIFDNYDHYCLDILQSLIILPLQEQKYDNIGQSYKAFVKEFVKIENEIGNPYYNLYILKGIVDIAREVRQDYLKAVTRKNSVDYFRKCVYERINFVSSFCRPKKINFDIMLCALFCLCKNIEGILYEITESQMNKKLKLYNKMPLKNIEQIFGTIDINLPDTYEYNENTTIYVMDCIKETCEKMKLNTSQISELNKTDSLVKGTVLYEFYNNKE